MFEPHQTLRDVAVRNKIVLQSLDLVPWALFVKRPHLKRVARALGYKDALQEGRILLLRAAELWDESKGKFSTYAVKCIRLGILDAFRTKSVALPQTPPKRLYRIAGGGGNGLNEAAEKFENQSEIEKLFKTLTHREREVIKLRYGLNGGDFYSFRETGRIFGISQERVRQIQFRALYKMKDTAELLKLKNRADGGETQKAAKKKPLENPWYLWPIPERECRT